jgi:nanoRNase/pAp phosphatase (c-di-AMP/oligoRNAs hydrolase)
VSSTNTEKINRFYDLFTDSDHVLIIINADPDSIASAMAVQRILWRRVTNVTITNINAITRPDNMAMIRLLDVTLIHLSKVDTSQYNKLVLLDSQPDHHEAFSNFEYTAIIDHHENSSINLNVPFSDIRPEYGATASIMTEYLRAAKIKPSSRLATGLFYAIKTDTANFERKAINEDMRAFQFLFKHANLHLSRKIEHVDLRLDFMGDFKKAINDHVISRNKIFIHLGAIKNKDICVLIADFFMRFNLITWSVVFGIHEDKLIIVVRNDGTRKDAGVLLSNKFGKFGPAGGHRSMARAEAQISLLAGQTDINDPKKLLAWIISQFENQSKREKKAKKK